MGFFEKMKKYNYNDVIEIYASCGHMCYTFSYNFDLNKSGDKWLFCCNCSVSDKEERVKSDNREITQEEAENVIKAAEESNLADKMSSDRRVTAYRAYARDNPLMWFICLRLLYHTIPIKPLPKWVK